MSLAGGLIYSANHYHSLYKDEQERADKAESLAQQRLDTINDMQVRQRDVAALDAKYTGELADAKSENENLRADIATGKRRLHIKATCPKSDTAKPGSMVDDASPRFDAGIEQHYWNLRDGISRVTKQVNYLQDYIRQQCLQ